MAQRNEPVRITVLLDGMENGIDAWSHGDQWNGFELPMFEVDQVQLLQKELQDDPAGPQVELIRNADGVVECRIDNSAMGEDSESVHMVRLETNEGIKEVFPVGAGSWTWWRVADY